MSEWIKNFYDKHKEVIIYLCCGALAFCVSIATYTLFSVVFNINVLIANIFSWVITVTFAYITNKFWVFKSKGIGFKSVSFEIMKFFGGRIFTLAVEEFLLFLFITIFGFNSIVVKIIAQIIVIVLNYIISKWFVFKKQRAN